MCLENKRVTVYFKVNVCKCTFGRYCMNNCHFMRKFSIGVIIFKMVIN